MLMCFNKLIDRPTERKTGRHANWSARRHLTHTDRRTHRSASMLFKTTTMATVQACRALQNITGCGQPDQWKKLTSIGESGMGSTDWLHAPMFNIYLWRLLWMFQRQCWGHSKEMGWSECVLSQAHRYHLEPDWSDMNGLINVGVKRKGSRQGEKRSLNHKQKFTHNQAKTASQ